MSVNVKLSEVFVEEVRRCASVQHRSVPKQIEYWSRIGKMVEDNPDLSFSMVQKIRQADGEDVVGEYVFG